MVGWEPNQRVWFEDSGDGNKYHGVITDVQRDADGPGSLRVDILWDTNSDVATYYYPSPMLDRLKLTYKLPRGNPNREFKEEYDYEIKI